MFVNPFVFIDTCVLAGALKRNVILHLADAGFFRPCWSPDVLEELRRVLERRFAAQSDSQVTARIDTLIDTMHRAFPEALIEGYRPLIESFVADLPDPNDAHIFAAASVGGASVVVTDNLRDFPDSVLTIVGLEAKSADTFVADAIDLNKPAALQTLRQMRQKFKRPEMTGAMLLDRFRNVGLEQAAQELEGFEGDL